MGEVLYYEAQVVSVSDYYPFGMGMQERSYASGSVGYRFGFNGQEKDDEVVGEGNSLTAKFWQYDSRLGRRWNVDPKPNFSISVYACYSNNPVSFADPFGDTIRFPNFATTFGFNFQGDINKIYSTEYGKSLVRRLHASTVIVQIEDASRWYLNDENDVRNSQTRGDYPNYWESKDGFVTVQYAQRNPIQSGGVSHPSYLVLAHEFVHALDISNGFFSDIYGRALKGEIKIPDLDFDNELGEVRAIIYTNAMRKELGLEIQTGYTIEGVTYELLDADGEPIKDYGFDITEGLFPDDTETDKD
ncbi:MAG: hypothetical protein HQ521_06620 [Bacteroidetes bacterium]|nr:hypothetical protein [Bacteroidota bacterium]